MSTACTDFFPSKTIFLKISRNNAPELWWPCAVFSGYSHLSRWSKATNAVDLRPIARKWFEEARLNDEKLTERLAITLGPTIIEDAVIFESDFGEELEVATNLGDLFITFMNIPGWLKAVDIATDIDDKASRNAARNLGMDPTFRACAIESSNAIASDIHPHVAPHTKKAATKKIKTKKVTLDKRTMNPEAVTKKASPPLTLEMCSRKVTPTLEERTTRHMTRIAHQVKVDVEKSPTVNDGTILDVASMKRRKAREGRSSNIIKRRKVMEVGLNTIPTRRLMVAMESTSGNVTPSSEDRSRERTRNDQMKACVENQQALPDKKGTLKLKLTCCLNVLHATFTVPKLSWSPSSTFQNQLNRVEKFMNAFVSSELPGGAMLYITGAPGTGKTCAVKQICQRLEETRKNVICCHTVGSQVKTRRNLMGRIAKSMFIPSDASDSKIQDALKFGGGRKGESRMVVLVIEGIDALLAIALGKGSTKPRNESEETLVTLIEWAKEPSSNFAVIGISRDVGMQQARRIRDLGMDGEHVEFSNFRKEDLIQIVIDRVGRNVCHQKAINFAANIVADGDGNVRLMLELTSLAVHKCLEEMSPIQQRSTELNGPLVKLHHMMKAVNTIISLPSYRDVSDWNPRLDNIVLCITAALTQADQCYSVISAAKLHSCTKSVIAYMNPEMQLLVRMFKDSVLRLFDQGLLKTNDERNLNSVPWTYGNTIPIFLGCELEDVEGALMATLGESVYNKLLETSRELDLENMV